MSILMSSASALPSYTPSDPTPGYTVEASGEEVSLESTTRRHLDRGTHSLVQVYNKGDITFSVTFSRQRETFGETPTYQQTELVEGYVELHNASGHNVADVVLEIEGRMTASSEGAGRMQHVFLRVSEELWRQDGSRSVPQRLEFGCRLPYTGTDDDGTERFLPSSTSIDTFSGVHASIQYSATVTLRIKGYGGLLKKHRSLVTPFRYLVRSHPPIPALPPDQSFFATIKAAPEMWSNLSMDVPLHNLGDPLLCTVALPSTRVFCISEPIPIHLQLAGPWSSLLDFLPESVASGSVSRPAGTPPVTIDIYFQRMLVLNLIEQVNRGQRLSSRVVIDLDSSGLGEGLLTWSGRLLVDPELSWTPECRMNRMLTVDSLVVEVRCPMRTGPRVPGSVMPQRATFPIKFVTDPFPSSF